MPEPSYALITGASSGIGEQFARALARRRRDLVLVARSKPKLDALAAEFRSSHGIRAEAIELDLSLPGAAFHLNERLRAHGLEIDLLVNNAGFGARGKFWELSQEREAQMLRLNIEALVELTHLLLPRMVGERRGAIINVSSTASFQPAPYIAVYAATKAFVTSFSEALAEELRPYGVIVVTLCPGGTSTNFFEASQYGTRNFPGGLQAPAEVVETALKALERGGGLVIPRLLNKATVFLERFVPRSWTIKAAARIFRT